MTMGFKNFFSVRKSKEMWTKLEAISGVTKSPESGEVGLSSVLVQHLLKSS